MARHARDVCAHGNVAVTMPPRLRNFVLAVHVASSVGLLGAVASFLALAVTGLLTADAALARAAYVAMKPVAWYVILPLIVASLIVGVIESLGTNWGLVRYWWVIAKLALTIVATAVFLLQMRLIDGVAAFAARAAVLPAELSEARAALVLHSAGGLVVLLLPVMLSIYKPRGRTRYGQRVAAA